jgi:hypothetical protein
MERLTINMSLMTLTQITVALIALSISSFSEIAAQQYISRNVHVSFFSETLIENIKAENNQSSSVFDISNGGIAFQVPIRAFHFDRALMEEHFNENYLETESYPNATFRGEIENWIDDFADGITHDIIALGILTIHGVEKEISASGTILFKNNSWIITSDFTVDAEDYDIKIPRIVRDNIAKSIEIKIQASLSQR